MGVLLVWIAAAGFRETASNVSNLRFCSEQVDALEVVPRFNLYRRLDL
jgi:hypothetical protein